MAALGGAAGGEDLHARLVEVLGDVLHVHLLADIRKNSDAIIDRGSREGRWALRDGVAYGGADVFGHGAKLLATAGERDLHAVAVEHSHSGQHVGGKELLEGYAAVSAAAAAAKAPAAAPEASSASASTATTTPAGDL